jgi:hypothetical protein
MGQRPRVVVACPDLVESELLIEWLSDGHDPFPTRLLQGAVHQVQTRQAHLVVADARFAFDDGFLSICRGGSAPTPLVVVGDPSPAKEAAAQRHGAFYVVRPVNRELLLCSVAMALVDARPVRRSPRIAVARYDAIANGIPASLIDVANEGMRLEMSRGRQSALPPFFTVRVPLVGLSLVVQRIWVSAAAGQASAHTWCGGALADNAARQVQRWRNFVGMVPRVPGATSLCSLE